MIGADRTMVDKLFAPRASNRIDPFVSPLGKRLREFDDALAAMRRPSGSVALAKRDEHDHRLDEALADRRSIRRALDAMGNVIGSLNKSLEKLEKDRR